MDQKPGNVVFSSVIECFGVFFSFLQHSSLFLINKNKSFQVCCVVGFLMLY